MTKTNVALTAFLVGVPVLFFFQNCAKSGSTNLTANTVLGTVNTTDSLNVVTANPNEVHLDDTAVGDKGSIGRCSNVVISDILLKINSVSSDVAKPNLESFEIVDKDKSISVEKMELKLTALNSERVNNLVLVLNQSGNKMLTLDNVVMDLKTPSDSQTAVSVVLAASTDVVSGRTYKLVLSVDPNDLVVTDKNTCRFKPVIQSASLIPL